MKTLQRTNFIRGVTYKMTYQFKCCKCGNIEVKEKMFGDYSIWKKHQICSKCGEKMERCLENEDEIYNKGENKNYD